MEEILNENLIYDGKVVKLKLKEVKLQNQKTAKREVIEHNGGAGIIAVTEDLKVPMVRQYRISVDDYCLEIPAGKLEKNEEPMSAAKRELEEETGFIAGNIYEIGQYYPTPGYTSEILYIYFADNLTKGNINLDEDEFLDVCLYDLKQLKEMLKNNTIKDCKTVIAINYACEKYGI